MVLKGEPTSNMGCTLKIKNPNKSQINFFKNNFNITKCAYNFGVAELLNGYDKWVPIREQERSRIQELDLNDKDKEKAFKDFCKTNKREYVLSPRKISVLLTSEIKKEDSKYNWMYKNGDSVSRFGAICIDLDNAFKRFKDGITGGSKSKSKKNFRYPYDCKGFPKFKKDNKSYHCGEVSVNNIDYKNNRIKLPVIGWVKFWKNQSIPFFEYPSKNIQPVISSDGIDYYVSFSYYERPITLNKEITDVIGIDLGVKNLATCSNGEVIRNFKNDDKIVKLQNKIKKLQRKLDKLRNGKSTKFIGLTAKEKYKTSSIKIRYIEKQIRKKQIQINNYRKNMLGEAVSNIISKNPKKIVLENLNVKGMQKNKKISSAIQNTGMYDFKLRLINKAKHYGIPVMEVDMFYPSSQICSSCGNRRPIKLSERVYRCPKCGLIIDRDLNASINLKNKGI